MDFNKYYILAYIGATIILTESKLFKPFREWWYKYWRPKSVPLSEFIQCQMCVGFWIGILLSLIKVTDLYVILCYGLMTSLFSYLAIEILTILKKK